MVQAHALAAGIETGRVTLDVDAAVRVEAGAFSYPEAASALIGLGYAADESARLAYRFARGTDIVDLMVGDHERPAPRYARRDVMQVTGGRQALGRLELIRFQFHDAEIPIPVPTLHGALILKAAAHTTDSRDRDRHLLDSMTLLACITDIEPIIGDLRGSDRKRLIHVIQAFDERPLVASQAPSDTVRLAERTLREFREALR